MKVNIRPDRLVGTEHVEQALAVASAGPVAEGNVGGGTGMICHGFKGGIGTASRIVEAGFTVGVLAQRAGLGIARLGAGGEHFSGDLLLAFATGNRGLPVSDYGADAPRTVPLQMLSDTHITALFDAVADATEEAILNALLAAETMTGRDGITAYALEAAALTEALRS